MIFKRLTVPHFFQGMIETHQQRRKLKKFLKILSDLNWLIHLEKTTKTPETELVNVYRHQ